jgi:hypothetical protein
VERFSKNRHISNFMKIRTVGAESFDNDGRTATMLVVACHNFAHAPEMECCLMNSMVQTHCLCVHHRNPPPPRHPTMLSWHWERSAWAVSKPLTEQSLCSSVRTSFRNRFSLCTWSVNLRISYDTILTSTENIMPSATGTGNNTVRW